MKTFANKNPQTLEQAVSFVEQARKDGQTPAVAGGGSDLLGMVKEFIVKPDVLVNLKAIKGLDQVAPTTGGVDIGGLITLNTLGTNPLVRSRYSVLAEAAETVATPQIRNVGTLAGNVCQRPWCWYFRNGFPCLKNGGDTCFSIVGDNRFHAIFGGGPSYIVHPSDTAPALVAVAPLVETGSAARMQQPRRMRRREEIVTPYYPLPSADSLPVATILERS